jgi:hypothetical protein
VLEHQKLTKFLECSKLFRPAMMNNITTIL